MIARDAEVDALYRQVEDRVTDLMARQAPVASDLRVLITALHVGGRPGADGRPRRPRGEDGAAPAPVAGGARRSCARCSRPMADVADRMAAKIATVISKLDAVGAAELETDDDAMDDCTSSSSRSCSARTGPTAPRPRSTAPCSGRFYERYADHAVNAGHHVIYLVTGEQDPAAVARVDPDA